VPETGYGACVVGGTADALVHLVRPVGPKSRALSRGLGADEISTAAADHWNHNRLSVVASVRISQCRPQQRSSRLTHDLNGILSR
jgi:hypothetical protein